MAPRARGSAAVSVLLAAVIAVCAPGADAFLVDANNQTLRSVNGCLCLSECGTSFDV